MNLLRHIRVNVFKVTQAEMAAIAGARQSTVSRWESGEFAPSMTYLQRIRAEALRRKLSWSDSWFFEERAA